MSAGDAASGALAGPTAPAHVLGFTIGLLAGRKMRRLGKGS
jgi:hypothetical protein